MTGPLVVGIDLSSRAIDLVALDENTGHATWSTVTLPGATGFERVRAIRPTLTDVLAHAGWDYWASTYLVAIERPFSSSRNDLIRLVEGSVLACIPHTITVWEVAPQTWKAALGFKGTGKPGFSDYRDIPEYASSWSQDALDAYGLALYARDLNAKGVAAALQGGAAA